MAPELQPRGWYPYDHGTEGYWDGSRWTGQTRPASPVKPMSPADAWTRSADTPAPRRRIPWSWIAADIVVGSAFVLVLVFIYRSL